MGYPKEVYDRAWQTLSQRRQSARDLTLRRRDEIHRRIPDIARIEQKLASASASVARAVIASPRDTAQRMQQLQRESLQLQEQRRQLLVENGYPADYLQEQFSCPACRDTGYRGMQMCDCLQELLKREAYAQLSAVSQARQCTFTDFVLDFYPETPVDGSGIIPRVRMGEILEVCSQYALHFSRDSESLLLLGQTGLGKTHLSLAIAAAATEAGYGVVYTPVQRLMDRLEAEKFSRDSDAKEQYAEDTRYVLECDLLVLDDLGTEFNNQFTASVLYNIINTRLVENRPTIINTNLELSQIEEKYSQRMISRLVCGYKVLKFMGKDIRFIKKTMA